MLKKIDTETAREREREGELPNSRVSLSAWATMLPTDTKPQTLLASLDLVSPHKSGSTIIEPIYNHPNLYGKSGVLWGVKTFVTT